MAGCTYEKDKGVGYRNRERGGGDTFKKLKGEEQEGEMRGFSIEKKRMALLGPSGHFIG